MQWRALQFNWAQEISLYAAFFQAHLTEMYSINSWSLSHSWFHRSELIPFPQRSLSQTQEVSLSSYFSENSNSTSQTDMALLKCKYTTICETTHNTFCYCFHSFLTTKYFIYGFDHCRVLRLYFQLTGSHRTFSFVRGSISRFVQ